MTAQSRSHPRCGRLPLGVAGERLSRGGLARTDTPGKPNTKEHPLDDPGDDSMTKLCFGFGDCPFLQPPAVAVIPCHHRLVAIRLPHEHHIAIPCVLGFFLIYFISPGFDLKSDAVPWERGAKEGARAAGLSGRMSGPEALGARDTKPEAIYTHGPENPHIRLPFINLIFN